MNCTTTVCGDDVVTPGEECDDGSMLAKYVEAR
jgi:cysteine-rich repeat protein